MKQKREFAISRSRKGHPVIGVGGGAYTNTFGFRTVLRDSKLLQPLFVRTRGSLACSTEQALVVIMEGDVILIGGGRRPATDLDNPDASVQAFKIISISIDKCETEEIDSPDLATFPAALLEAADRYHNRDGLPFTTGPNKV